MIVMMGDFNAKIGDQTWERGYQGNEFQYVEGLMEGDKEAPVVLERRLAEGTRNRYGRELERIAAQEKLVSVNGTYIEGPESRYTCFMKVDKPSVIDLGWCSESHIEKIQALVVHDFMPDLSDHAPVGMIIKCGTGSDTEEWQEEEEEVDNSEGNSHEV